MFCLIIFSFILLGGVGEKIHNVVFINDSEYMVVSDCSNATESVSV